MTSASAPLKHPFITAPNRTLLALALPVLLSLIAEPITGLVDTFFVARLGSAALAALGVGTMALSGSFWVFSFLGVGAQTEIAQAQGQDSSELTSSIAGSAISLSSGIGLLIVALGFYFISPVASLMGASNDVHQASVLYMQVRIFGAPAVLITMAAFGIMRGMQDMKTPLYIAVALNLINVVLDSILIFGWGFVPAFGIAGAAWATTVSQWTGAFWCLAVLQKRLPFSLLPKLSAVKRLVHIGGDMFVRTGLLTLFLMMSTRVATQIGADSGAANQAIRQSWLFTALFLDSFAVAGQSLVGYFYGSRWYSQARRVALAVCLWSAGTGLLLTVVMLAGRGMVTELLVPASAAILFQTPWLIASVVQPINAIAFATDGVHWGTGDFRFLRNVMILVSIFGFAGLFLVDVTAPWALTAIWIITAIWTALRAVCGVIRIWPGIADAPLQQIDRMDSKMDNLCQQEVKAIT